MNLQEALDTANWLMEREAINDGSGMADLSDEQVAFIHMSRIIEDIDHLQEQIHNLRIEYWGWQAVAYPVNECHHGPAHFCANCGNNQEAHDPRDDAYNKAIKNYPNRKTRD